MLFCFSFISTSRVFPKQNFLLNFSLQIRGAESLLVFQLTWYNFMKRINNKFRNNNNNNNYNPSYSLNYKFDSTSIAGKICGTALDLIKRYNDLARDAQSNGDYVNAETFRQYAEHYRKIVTDINERRNYQPNNNGNYNRRENGYNGNGNGNHNPSPEELAMSGNVSQNECINGNVQGCEPQESAANVDLSMPIIGDSVLTPSEEPVKKEFKVIEISSTEGNVAGNENEKPKRTYRRKNVAE